MGAIIRSGFNASLSCRIMNYRAKQRQAKILNTPRQAAAAWGATRCDRARPAAPFGRQAECGSPAHAPIIRTQRDNRATLKELSHE